MDEKVYYYLRMQCYSFMSKRNCLLVKCVPRASSHSTFNWVDYNNSPVEYYYICTYSHWYIQWWSRLNDAYVICNRTGLIPWRGLQTLIIIIIIQSASWKNNNIGITSKKKSEHQKNNIFSMWLKERWYWITDTDANCKSMHTERKRKQSNNKKLNGKIFVCLLKNGKFPCDRLTIYADCRYSFSIILANTRRLFWNWSDAMNGKHLFIVCVCVFQMDLEKKKKKKNIPAKSKWMCYVWAMEHVVHCCFAITRTINAHLMVMVMYAIFQNWMWALRIHIFSLFLFFLFRL